MLKLPSWASVLLGLGAGLLAVLNEVSFGFSTEWRWLLLLRGARLPRRTRDFAAGRDRLPRRAAPLHGREPVRSSSALRALALAAQTFNLAEGLLRSPAGA